MKQVVILVLVVMLCAGLAMADLEQALCKTRCQAEHMDWAEWQRDGWCNTKCATTSAWGTVKGWFDG